MEGSSKKIIITTKGRGENVVIENVGSAQSMKWSLSCLERRGRLVAVRTMMNDLVLKKML